MNPYLGLILLLILMTAVFFYYITHTDAVVNWHLPLPIVYEKVYFKNGNPQEQGAAMLTPFFRAPR